MTSTTRSSRRAALAAAVATLLCAAPVMLAAQTTNDQLHAGQPPAGGGRGGMGARGMAMLMQGITLSDAQRTQLDSVQAAGRTRMQAMRSQMMQGGGRPDSATMASMRQEMETQRSAMRAVLTPDQQKTFDANIAKMREQAQQRMRDGGAGGMGGPGRG